MKRLMAVLPWLGVFVVLDLYANWVPRLVGFAIPVWLAYVLGFFVLTALLCRYVLGITTLQPLGLARPRGWWRHLALGFAIGFGVWTAKNLLFAGMGKFDVVGLRGWDVALPLLAQAVLGMFLASAINDVMIRGLGLAFCRRFQWMAWYVLITCVLYALDDAWNEGLDPGNLVFSLVLGLSLAYTVLKTGMLWMSIGIHWGGNVCYRLIAGFDGHGVVRLDHVVDGTRYEVAALVVTALMFPLVVWALRRLQPSDPAP